MSNLWSNVVTFCHRNPFAPKMAQEVNTKSAMKPKPYSLFQRLYQRHAFPMSNHNIVAYFVIWTWCLVEIGACATVLIKGKHEHAANFLYGLCPSDDATCGHFIRKALVGRIVVAALMLVGNVTVSGWAARPCCGADGVKGVW